MRADGRPPRLPPPLGPGGLVAVLVTGAAGFVVALGVVALVLGHPPAPGSPGAAATQGLALLAGASAAILSDPRRHVPLRRRLGLRGAPALALAAALVGGLALQLPLAAVAVAVEAVAPTDPAIRETLEALVAPDTAVGWVASVLALAVAAPLAEEVVFRGLLLRGLAGRLGPVPASVATSLLFGAVHGTPASVAYASLAGLALAALTLRCGSIVPAVAAHAGVNAAPMLLYATGLGSLDAADPGPALDAVPPALAAAGALAAAAALTLAARVTRRARADDTVPPPG